MLFFTVLHVTNGTKEELFQRLICSLALFPHSSVLGVNSSGGRALDVGAGAYSVWNWVGRDDKGGGWHGVVDIVG